MSDTAWTLILVALYLGYCSFFLCFSIISIYIYSDEGENIVFRYFTAGIVGGKKNSVEINKRTFAGYKTESRFFGLIQSITLFQQFKEGVAKYPPVYISALQGRRESKLFRSLNLYTAQAVKVII